MMICRSKSMVGLLQYVTVSDKLFQLNGKRNLMDWIEFKSLGFAEEDLFSTS